MIERGRERRERDNRLRALCPPYPHTLGYIGGCDQEQGEIECLEVGAGDLIASGLIKSKSSQLTPFKFSVRIISIDPPPGPTVGS